MQFIEKYYYSNNCAFLIFFIHHLDICTKMSSQKNQNFNKFDHKFGQRSNERHKVNQPLNNFTQSYYQAQKMEIEDENLLDDISEKNSNSGRLQKMTFSENLSFTNSHNQSIIMNQVQSFPMNSYNEPLQQKKQQKREKTRKTIDDDEELLQLMKLVEKKPAMIEKQKFDEQGKKILTERQLKKRQTLNRLSQNLQIGKSSVNSNRESCKKRRTLTSFGFNSKANQNTNKQGERKVNVGNLSDENFMNRQTNQNENLPKPFHPKMSNQELQKNLNAVQMRRNRITVDYRDISNMLSFFEEQKKSENESNALKSSQKEDINQKQNQNMEKNTRVTMDYGSLARMLQNSIEQQQTNENHQSNENRQNLEVNSGSKKTIEKLNQNEIVTPGGKFVMRRHTQFYRPSYQPSSVIQEDDEQDEFTPFKQLIGTNPSRKSLNLPFSMSKKKYQKTSEKLKEQQDIRKVVFKQCFQNLDEKIEKQRKKNEELRKIKMEILNEKRKKDNQTLQETKQLKELKKQYEDIEAKIIELKSKLDKPLLLQYQSYIHLIELKFGVRIHKFENLNRQTKSGSNKLNQGFSATFTLDDLLFRIKRNKGDEHCDVKFLVRQVFTKECLDLKIRPEDKQKILKEFINRKLTKTVYFLEFLAKIVNYCKALTQYELTLEYYFRLMNLENSQYDATCTVLQLTYPMIGNGRIIQEYKIIIDLIELMDNGGIKVWNNRSREVKLPEKVTQWTKDGNKLINVFEYLTLLPLNDLEEAMESKIQNLELPY